MAFALKGSNFSILILFILPYLSILLAQKLCVLETKLIDQDEYSPLILKPTEKLEFLYPLNGNPECFMANLSISQVTMRLACPYGTVKFFGAEVNESASIVPLNIYSEFRIPGHAENLFMYNFNGEPNAINCNKRIEGIMTKLYEEQTRSRLHVKTSRNVIYNKVQIGFQLNELDFLPVIRIFISKNRQLHWAQTKLVSVIESRNRLEESFDNYKSGLMYQEMSTNISEIYTVEYQRLLFQDNLVFLDNIKDNNYIVPGQLISRDDLFYNAQRRSTYFYENTTPMWQSIRDGNWKLTGEVARTLADRTITDFDLFCGSVNYPSYDILLNPREDESKKIYVPKILFRIIYDSLSLTRGIAFIIINNPFTYKDEFRYINEYICSNVIERCKQFHPEFQNITSGFTVCCNIEDFKIWDDIAKEMYYDNYS